MAGINNPVQDMMKGIGGAFGGDFIPGMGGVNPTGSGSNLTGDLSTINNFDPKVNNTIPFGGMDTSIRSTEPPNRTVVGATPANTPPVATSTIPFGGGENFTGPPVNRTNTNQVDPNTGLPISLLNSLGLSTSVFPTNTNNTVGGTGTSGIQNLNLGSLLGFNANDPNLTKELDNMFGQGVGTALMQFLAGGAGYNPAIATALINQMSPLEEEARNQILESFGASGGRYSSPAGIGLADYESSFSLGQQGILANLANAATDRYSNLFGGLINTAYLTQANKPNIFNIISGLLPLLQGLKLPGGITLGGGNTTGTKTGGNTTGTPPTFPKPTSTTPGTTTDTGPGGKDSGLPGHEGWKQDANGMWYNPNDPNMGLLTTEQMNQLFWDMGVIGDYNPADYNFNNLPVGGYDINYNDPFGAASSVDLGSSGGDFTDPSTSFFDWLDGLDWGYGG